MRPIILFMVVGWSVLAVGGWPGAQAHATEGSKDITRVAIAISGGSVAYTDQSSQDPPAIVIEFRSRNVIAALEPAVVVNSGIIKEIQSDYYPPDRRALKRLTLTLVQPAAYTIVQQANQIVVDIDTPASVLPGRMAVGQGVTVLGIEAKETLMQRLKVMEGALQQAGPQTTPAPKPKPVVVTKPVEIPQPVLQPAPAPTPVSKKGLGGFWPGLLLGIGGTVVVIAGWRRRRKAVVAPGGPAEFASIAQDASVYEGLILKAVQRQGQKVISSKTIEGLGTVWIIEKEGSRQGLLCLIDGAFFERKVLEQFLDALKQETLQSGVVYALGAFTAPAQAFAKEYGIELVAREEVLKMVNVELKAPVLDPAAAAQLAELTQELAQKSELTAKLSQELDQLKAKSAEVDQRLAAEQEKRVQLEAQILELEEQLEVQAAATRAEKERIQEVAAVTKEPVTEVVAGAPSVPQERRKWARLDLSRREGKGILVRATSEDGEPLNGDARNISAGGLCVELPQVERLADEFEVKLFLPDRAKPIEAIGKLMWKGRGSRRRMGQLGIAFSAVNAGDQEAISQFVEERLPAETAAQAGTPEPLTVG